jgi:hypothetical protein
MQPHPPGPGVDRKSTHLETLGSIANRMRLGSLLAKGWSVMVVAMLLAVATDPRYGRFAWLAVFLAIAFWMLDAHFSRQVRLFRKVQAKVRSQSDSQVDFRLDTSPVDNEKDAFATVLFSPAVSVFHAGVLLLIAVVRAR